MSISVNDVIIKFMKSIKTIIITLAFILVSSCGVDGNPKISHVVVKNDSQGIILDSKDSTLLNDFTKVFYDKDEHPEGGPAFMYLIDITTTEGTVRWQYNPNGNIRNFELPDSPIYRINDIVKFNRLLGIPNPK